MAIGIFGLIPSSSPDELRKILEKLSTKWGDVVEDFESLEVKPMKGAMTNEVFMVSWPRKETKFGSRKLLVRVYGEGVDVFFNRDDEIRTFEFVARQGHGPTLLGRFPGGRVEEFIHARTLSATDLRDPNISGLVASKLRGFHSIHIPGDRTVLIWDRMRTWVGQAKNLCSNEHSTEFGLDNIEDEINLLEQEVNNEQEIGFCHNDLQCGNIMIDEETNAITIIDYEYASYNPIAYDIANHFCEMVANYHSDTPHILDYTLYPGEEERRRFICNYLTSSDEEPREEDIEQLLDETEKYTLASHLFWGLWGIISGYVNKIEFDYIEYSRQRFKQYWLRKPQLLSFYPSS
ncbi:PREDICTED: probable choline kinase 3 isoform X2 [Camelina sativa]|nr:PREDICTED: probable choline kinase 3 isoform X2 [Camelina sativa]